MRSARFAAMAVSDIPHTPSLFSTTLNEFRELYVAAGRLCAHEYPHLIPQSGDQFVELMDDLHRALVLKVYVSVCEADRKWSNEERYFAETLFHHLWGQRLTGDDLRTAAKRAARRRTWVDFPVPSPPSNVMNLPAAMRGA